MIIRHILPTHCYTKIDKKVFTDPRLTDGAKVLYGYLCGLRNGANFTDNYLLVALKLSEPTLRRRKKELKDIGLIHVEQISKRVYVIYIGNSTKSAIEVKDRWVAEEEG